MISAAGIEAEILALPSRYTTFVRDLRKRHSAALKAEPAEAVVALARDLEARRPQEGKWVAYELIRHHKGAYAAVTEAVLADFATRATTWYSVDALGTILTGPLWAKGRLSDSLVERWSRAPEWWLRRSALVATVGLNARMSGGPGDAARTLAVCRALAADREDLVVKAMSWALRVLADRDRAAVEGFMAEVDEVLAARVKREVATKLRTGLKNAWRLKPSG